MTPPSFSAMRIRPDAVLPVRSHPEDVGFDVTLIEKGRSVQDTHVTFYHTGLVVVPPPGFYFDLVPRSSLAKSGYALANSVGIIDPNYRGEILVALRKVDPALPDLPLPSRLVQLVPRVWHPMTCEEVSSVTATDRGDGGFGSTS